MTLRYLLAALLMFLPALVLAAALVFLGKWAMSTPGAGAVRSTCDAVKKRGALDRLDRDLCAEYARDLK